MKKEILRRIEELENTRKQCMCDRVRVTLADGSTKIVDYYEPVYDGYLDDIVGVELLEGIGIGAEVLTALIQDVEEE